MIEFDHIAVSGETLAEARAHVEDALGVHMQPGGQHDVFFTHNALLGLDDGLYLEAIAINPDAPQPDRPRWFDLDRFSGPPRLTNWICRTGDLDGVLDGLSLDMGAPVALQRDDLLWSMAVPATGILPFDNCAPALIQWHTLPHPATLLQPSGIRLTRLTVRHPSVQSLEEALGTIMDNDRIKFETGAAGFEAVFATPHGERTLS